MYNDISVKQLRMVNKLYSIIEINGRHESEIYFIIKHI